MLSMENEFFFFLFLLYAIIPNGTYQSDWSYMYVWCAFISKRHIFVIGLQFKLYLTLQTSTYLQMMEIIIGKMVALNVYSHDDEGFFTD